MKHEIHFVTGKGGVGKSAVAAALALRLSRQGKKVLLVELGDQSFFKDYFNLEKVDFRSVSWQRGLNISLWTGEECLREYATHLIKVESVAKLFLENPVMKVFISVAPGLRELAILGKATSVPRRHGPPMDYDAIVIDAYATGHFKALLQAPHGMSQAFKLGPMAEQSRGIEAVLKNSEICQFHIVTLPEELPVREAVELWQYLKSEFGVTAQVLVNKCLPESMQQAASENPPAGLELFSQYLRQHLSQQQRSISSCEQATANSIRSLPLILENKAEAVVEALSGVV